MINLRKGVDNVVYKVYNIREAARCCQKEREVKTMKEKMMKYVLERYPKATEFRYVENVYGRELQFLPNSGTIDCYTCIVKNGTMQILREF